MSNTADREKRNAAERSLSYIEDGMVLGLGTGSTAAHMVDLLGARVRDGLRIRGVPTSRATEAQAAGCGIPLTTLDEVVRVDLTIDGADEADDCLRLIKGGGGALLREKIIASISDRMIVIADSSKLVDRLGAFALPVEVTPFADHVVSHALGELGARAALRMAGDGVPFITDGGNHIVDCDFGPIADAEGLAGRIRAIVGVVEHGLFIGLADRLIIGRGAGVEVIEGGSP